MTILFILVFSIPLASLYLSTILIHRFAAHILLDSCVILGSEIYGRLFQITILSKIPIILGGFSFIEEPNILLTCFVPIMIYFNPDTARSQILADNKGKAGIYQWTHKESGKTYIGSAVNLSKRMRTYYSIGYLERNKSMYICNALFNHGYSSFTLTIYAYIDISQLTKEEAKKMILALEQFYLDSLQPKYNILKIAGSRLGSLHTEETRALISETMIGINHGRTHSTETRALMSKALSGENHPRGFLGKIHSPETIAKISTSKGGGLIYVYDTQGTLVNTFTSARKAALHFECSQNTILKYAKNGNIFKDKWKLSTFEL